jgi:polar amino acid transport system ATP-binding protein
LLEVTGLTKRHGEREVLRGVSLTLERGGVGVVMGPSGSGKSTLLRCINGLETFDGGDIRVGGASVPRERNGRAGERSLEAVRRRVGMVFQGFHLFPHLSVLGNVVEAPVHVLGLPREEAVERARGLLARVGLGDRLDAAPEHLSGGEQQRVAIARALAMRPEIVLFDEPTSALDPRMTSEVLAVMTELARDGQTMLVATHAREFARRAASEIHVICDGVIVESGAPDRVLDHPSDPRARDVLQAEEGWVAGNFRAAPSYAWGRGRKVLRSRR